MNNASCVKRENIIIGKVLQDLMFADEQAR